MSNERKLVTLDDVQRRHVASHTDPYYAWLRHVVTLATGELTVLVAVQGNYLKPPVIWPWLLIAVWFLLAATIGFGLIALAWHHQAHLRAAEILVRHRHQYGDAAAAQMLEAGQLAGRVPAMHKWSVRLMTASFAMSLLALCFFSSASLLRQA